MMLKIVLLIVLSAFLKGISCAQSLGQLFRLKYPEVYNLPMVEYYGDFPPPLLPVYAPPLLNADFLNLLDNFENDPMAVFNEEIARKKILRGSVRKFRDEEEISLKLINKILEHAPPLNFILEMLNEAIASDLEGLFDYLISIYPEILLEDHTAADYLFNNTIIPRGKYKYAQKLMNLGVNLGPPGYLARESFKSGRTETICPVIDFLTFLIVQRKEFDVNEPIWPDEYSQPEERLLFHLLNNQKTTRDFKERVAEYLISIGADPWLTNINGMDAFEVAEIQEISLINSERILKR